MMNPYKKNENYYQRHDNKFKLKKCFLTKFKMLVLILLILILDEENLFKNCLKPIKFLN